MKKIKNDVGWGITWKSLSVNQTRKRTFLTIVLGVLLSLLYVAIFNFSEQDAETSSSLSMEVTERCVETITELSGQPADESLKHMLAVKYEKYVRKAAHFTEYAGTGVLSCLILALWMVKSRGRLLCNAAWLLVSGTVDEIHQAFVPGRFSSPFDVLIDTAGGLFGVFLAMLMIKLIRYLGRIIRKTK
ncbi:MAG: VanZ family protein [Eubacterium sp.]|nr:VanZ family protein [Eubacterium sp.]